MLFCSSALQQHISRYRVFSKYWQRPGFENHHGGGLGVVRGNQSELPGTATFFKIFPDFSEQWQNLFKVKVYSNGLVTSSLQLPVRQTAKSCVLELQSISN